MLIQFIFLLVENLLYQGQQIRTLKLWDVKKGKQIREFKGHKDWVNSVCFSSLWKICYIRVLWMQ